MRAKEIVPAYLAPAAPPPGALLLCCSSFFSTKAVQYDDSTGTVNALVNAFSTGSLTAAMVVGAEKPRSLLRTAVCRGVL